jgi:hypothetical protein
MSTQEFKSVNSVSAVIDNVFPGNQDVKNSIYRIRDATKTLLDNPEQVFNLEIEPGMSLNTIARDYLGDSFLWESIGILNDVRDPTAALDIGKILKVPTTEQLKAVSNKLLVPEVNKVISSVKGSILDFTGLSQNNTPLANNLKDCIDKIIDFKINF